MGDPDARLARSQSLPAAEDVPSRQRSPAPMDSDQEAGVLRDILDELDRERSRRAELEAQLREITERQALDILAGHASGGNRFKQKQPATRTENQSPTSVVSRQDWIALQTERDGYLELLNTLTKDNDAIAHAVRGPSSRSLPLHVVRLLEIMPWHNQAKEHAFATEDIYEWQFYNKGEWNSTLRTFPVRFRTLPTVKPLEQHHNKRLFGEQPPRQGVLTDALLTQIIDVSQGYPLPNDEFSTWEWVAGWIIEKHPTLLQRKIDCDQHGWSYAQDAQHFLAQDANLVWDHSGPKDKVTRPFRRRNWQRRRVLVSYPHACQCATEYLQLLRENAQLTITAQKLSDQLIETKTKLTQTEENLMKTRETGALELEKVKRQLAETREKLEVLELSAAETPKSNGKHSRLRRRSRKQSSDGTVETTDGEESASSLKSDHDNDDDSAGSDGKNRFDWKRFGRGGLLEQIKKSPAGSSLVLSGRSGSPTSQQQQQEATDKAAES